MKIKDISVSTIKNHLETKISFESSDFINGCYLDQVVCLASDADTVACRMVTGISSSVVLTCADALPAVPSTKNNKYPYHLITKVFDANDSLVEERTDVFEFTLPEHSHNQGKQTLFKKFFGKKN